MTQQSALRVLIADHDTLRGGGQLGLTRYLQSPSRFDLSVLTMADGIVTRTARARGLPTFVVLPSPGTLGFLRTLAALRGAIRRAQPDVVVTNSLRMANLLSLCLKRSSHGPRYIAYLREDLSRKNLGMLKRLYMCLITIRRCDGLLVNSAWTGTTVPNLLRKPARVAYPVSGVSMQRPRPLSRAEEPLRVLSLSRLTEWKGIHILLQACGILTASGFGGQLAITIAGEGKEDDPYVKQLNALAKASGVDTAFLGHVDDVDELLRSHDVLAHCSLRPEAYGQVIPQALSHGVVVIATDAGGPAEMVKHGESGVLIPPGEPAELARALRILIEDRDAAISLAESGRALSARYEDARTIVDFETAVASLASRAG